MRSLTSFEMGGRALGFVWEMGMVFLIDFVIEFFLNVGILILTMNSKNIAWSQPKKDEPLRSSFLCDRTLLMTMNLQNL